MGLFNNVSFPDLYKIKQYVTKTKRSRRKLKILKFCTTAAYIVLFIGVSYASKGGSTENLKTVTDLIDKVQKGAEWLVYGIILIQGLFQIYESNNDLSGVITAFMEAWVKYSMFRGILNLVSTFFGSGLIGVI